MLRMNYLVIPIVVTMWMAPFLGACSTSRTAASGMPHTNSFIRIGSGGGFSGIFSGYLFNADGSIYKWKIGPGESKEETELVCAERDSVRRFFDLLDGIGFRSYDFDHPGNMTRFIELYQYDSLHSVHWGDPGFPSPQPITELHQHMMSFAQARL